MAAKPSRRTTKKSGESDPAVSYDEFKTHEGRRYTGMKVGRSHKWYYDQGEWKETKITTDLWQISYAVTKRRAGRAPEGSGVPVGTDYHWYVLAHQNVCKLNANDYATSMSGLKFKIAYKGGHREMERDATDAAEADDFIPARRDRRSGKRAGGERGDSRTARRQQ